MVIATVSGYYGFTAVDNASKTESDQTRALTVLSNIEHIDRHISELEKLAYVSSMQGNKQLQEKFWLINAEVLADIDNQALPLHGSDCKTCHKTLKTLKPEFDLILADLSAVDKSKLSRQTDVSLQQKQLFSTLKKLNTSISVLDNASKTELKDVSDAADKVSKKSLIKARLDRAKKFRQRILALQRYSSTLSYGVISSDPIQIQLALVELPALIKGKGDPPPKNSSCSSCHRALIQLRDESKNLPEAATALFNTTHDGKDYAKSLERFSAELNKSKKTMMEILTLAKADVASTMHESQKASMNLRAFMLLAYGLSIIGFSSAIVYLVMWLKRRLSVFSEAIESISNGKYPYIADSRSNDELSDLACAFNSMTNKIRSNQDALTGLNQELRDLHFNTVKAFVKAIEAKDAYTRGHSENVAKYALMLGQELRLSVAELEEIHAAALLHDVGKIGIPENILNKPGSLTAAEFKTLKTHPELSAQIVEDVPHLSRIAKIIRHHHEHYDGTGYCDGLSGEDIPYGSRILAIADAFDAMVSDRPYRMGWKREFALEEIRKIAGIQFDPEMADVFVGTLSNQDEEMGEEQSIA
jgi:putative nucleotidyltransferase with HDIG domain